VVMSPAGVGPKNDCAGEGQQQLYTTDPSSRERGCYIGIISASVQLENKNSGRGSQGTCHQNEPTGGKLPVVK
jgi:hypothetical protein